MLTRNEQIQILNTTVKCKLAPSPIHGIGVFAIRDIKKGDRCFVRRLKGDTEMIFNLSWSALQEVDKDIRDIIVGRWPNVVNNGKFFTPNDDQRLNSFVNHGEQNWNPFNDTALKDIKAGDEILLDYRKVEQYNLAYPWLN